MNKKRSLIIEFNKETIIVIKYNHNKD